MLYDSHAHLNFSAFAENYKEITADCLKNEIGVLNIGSQFETSQRALEIANEFLQDPIYASIGMHPCHFSGTEDDPEEIVCSGDNNFNEQKYQALINADKNSKIIAIGEIGLDYYHTESTENKKTQKSLEEIKNLQKQGLIAQLNFAQKNNLPIILHARGSAENPQDAYLDLLEILKNWIPDQVRNDKVGAIHCFGSTLEIAQKFIDLGFYIGFTGIITFKNKSVNELREVVRQIPLDKILIETDAPYLTPEPHRGKKNQPQYVKYVAEKVGEIKNIPVSEVKKQTTQNFKTLFL